MDFSNDLELLIPIISIGGGMLVVVTIILVSGMTKITRNKQREQSRREIAAYVAEGSMTAEEGERLIAAGQPKWERGCN